MSAWRWRERLAAARDGSLLRLLTDRWEFGWAKSRRGAGPGDLKLPFPTHPLCNPVFLAMRTPPGEAAWLPPRAPPVTPCFCDRINICGNQRLGYNKSIRAKELSHAPHLGLGRLV